MMLAFDTPIPFSTIGRRNVSNVPAQALILMNDPFVAEQADVVGQADCSPIEDASPEARIRQMYLEAFGREPTSAETAAALAFLSSKPASTASPRTRLGTTSASGPTWAMCCSTSKSSSS